MIHQSKTRSGYLVTCFILALTIAACSTLGVETESVDRQEYSFRAIQDFHKSSEVGGLEIPSLDKMMGLGPRLGDYTAAFRGSLLQLFGEPLSSSDLTEEAYVYVIEASDVQSRTWVLWVVQGSFGPAILGDSRDESVYPVAEALLDLIEKTPPADFEAIIYDGDSDSTITYGCESGRCYARDTPGRHVGP